MNGPLGAQCHSVLQLLDDPWRDDVLNKILQGKSVDDSAGNYTLFFRPFNFVHKHFPWKKLFFFLALKFLESNRHFLRTRLSILCEDKNCYELAEKMAAVVWSFYKQDRNHLSFFMEEDLHYILDLYLVILVRQGKKIKIITQVSLYFVNYSTPRIS